MDGTEKIVDERICANCGSDFQVLERDRAFYEKVDVPFPTWCPACRHIRRHGHVNDYVYYPRTCDACSKRFVAMFPAESSYRVVCQTCWYSEHRDDKAEGRDYDPSRRFFEQFDELMHAAPQMGNLAVNVENSEYCESIADCKNCYLISECSHCEDCLYAYWIQKTQDSIDNCYLHGCERCYEVSDSFNCYRLKYSSNCQSCSDSVFLDNCISCSNCAFCVNLRHKAFHIFNEPCSKEEYASRLAALGLDDSKNFEQARMRFHDLVSGQPRKHLQIEQSQSCVGDYIRNAKNCYTVFHCYDAEDCSYGEHVWRGAKDCMDVHTAGRGAELLYECTNTNMGAYHSMFCRYCWGCRFTEYSNFCVNSSHLFGCVGLQAGNKFCVLNKQYTESDYHALVAQIKTNMRRDGEYGEFFPLAMSLFGYNNSVSYDDRHYTKQDVLAKGWKWESASVGTSGKGTIEMRSIPTKISEVADSISDEVLTCEACERNYKIVKRELLFYRAERIPIPRACPDCRHRTRLKQRNPKELRTSHCSDCGIEVLTTLDGTRYRIIVCESCYQKRVY